MAGVDDAQKPWGGEILAENRARSIVLGAIQASAVLPYAQVIAMTSRRYVVHRTCCFGNPRGSREIQLSADRIAITGDGDDVNYADLLAKYIDAHVAQAGYEVSKRLVVGITRHMVIEDNVLLVGVAFAIIKDDH